MGTVETGITMGSVLAMIISWEAYHSIVWSIIYGICSWLFVGWWYFWG